MGVAVAGGGILVNRVTRREVGEVAGEEVRMRKGPEVGRRWPAGMAAGDRREGTQQVGTGAARGGMPNWAPVVGETRRQTGLAATPPMAALGAAGTTEGPGERGERGAQAGRVGEA